jgi:hypothetical protein
VRPGLAVPPPGEAEWALLQAVRTAAAVMVTAAMTGRAHLEVFSMTAEAPFSAAARPWRPLAVI